MDADEFRRILRLSPASDVIGSVEVLEPNTTSGSTACAFAVASAFTLRSSNTASIDQVATLQRVVIRRRR